MSRTQFTHSGSDKERVARRSQMARALTKGGMEGTHIISLETARKILTPKRHEIIALLSHEEVASVRALARMLNRDKGQVSRDLQVLAAHGIIQYDTDGRSKSPQLIQEHILIEPVV